MTTPASLNAFGRTLKASSATAHGTLFNESTTATSSHASRTGQITQSRPHFFRKILLHRDGESEPFKERHGARPTQTRPGSRGRVLPGSMSRRCVPQSLVCDIGRDGKGADLAERGGPSLGASRSRSPARLARRRSNRQCSREIRSSARGKSWPSRSPKFTRVEIDKASFKSALRIIISPTSRLFFRHPGQPCFGISSDLCQDLAELGHQFVNVFLFR